MSIKIIIFPNQLYSIDVLDLLLDTKKPANNNNNKVTIYLIEEPIYYYSKFHSGGIPLNFNKSKLVMQRAAMKYYYDYLQEQIAALRAGSAAKAIEIKYIDYAKLNKNETDYCFLNSRDIVYMFDPVDRALSRKLKGIANAKNLTLVVLDNPNYFATPADLQSFIATHNGDLIHKTFYDWQKTRMGILDGVPSYDQENRDKLPRGLSIPPLPPNDNGTKWVKEAIAYINKLFPDNYGDGSQLLFPITHETAYRWLIYFLDTKFANFGAYQDAMSDENDFLFHSMLSPMINLGLLNVKEVLQYVTAKYNTGAIAINNYEGFVRQLIGWRDYSYMLYLFKYDEMVRSNHFNNDRALSEKWYLGQTGIYPIDDTIGAAFTNGYLHHILRLMMMANFMNLCQIHPHQAYRWFMEFSCDSYDWVMINNVYSMGMWADGGLTMRKPYISSDNYIFKMSDYAKDGHWETIWNDLFYYFLYRNEQQLRGTPYLRNLAYFNKKSPVEQKALITRAQNFIDSVTITTK